MQKSVLINVVIITKKLYGISRFLCGKKKKEHSAFCQVGIVTLNREKRVWARHVIINILTHAFLSSVGRYSIIHFRSTHEDTEAQTLCQ